MNKRIEDIIAETRLNEILHKNEAEKQKNTVIWTLAIIGAVARVICNRLCSISFCITGLS